MERPRAKMRSLSTGGLREPSRPAGIGAGAPDYGGPIDYVCATCENVILPGRHEEPLSAGYCASCNAYSAVGPTD
jgi:hypothetical protein